MHVDAANNKAADDIKSIASPEGAAISDSAQRMYQTFKTCYLSVCLCITLGVP